MAYPQQQYETDGEYIQRLQDVIEQCDDYVEERQVAQQAIAECTAAVIADAAREDRDGPT